MNVVRLHTSKRAQGKDSVTIAFIGAIGVLGRYVKGQRTNTASLEQALIFLSDLLDEYVSGKREGHERIFRLFETAIDRIPYFSAGSYAYAVLRLRRQWKRLMEFQGGAYEEELLPKLFIEELQKLLDEGNG